MGKKVFVSYSRRDIEIVKELISNLRSKLGDVFWIDLKGIESGDEFEDVIVDAIDNCEILLFMHSENSIKSEWAKKEVRYASSESKKVVPLLIDENQLKGWYKFNYGGTDFIDAKVDTQIEKLIRDLASWLNIEIKEEPVFQTPEPQEEEDPDEKYFDQNVVVAQQYELGDGVAQNYEIAFQQYQVSAKKKNPFAIYKLGEYYQNGWIGEVDHVEAMKKYKKAVELGYTGPRLLIGMMYANGLGVTANAKKAMEWFMQGADEGDYDSMAQIGLLYLYGGKGVAEDPAEAKVWFEKAAEGKQGEAMLNLGLMYKQGVAVNKNDKKAVAWFRKASNAGSINGHINLGLCYEKGEGVEIDLPRAFKLYEKAYKQGETWASVLMADMYMEGRGIDRDIDKAIELLNEAVELNDYEALDKLAICYAQGIGVTKDIEKAKELFIQSIHLGHTPAIEHYNEYIGLEAGVVMFIEDIFCITGRGTVVTGVLTSDIKVGDNVIIKGDNEEQIECIIIGVEMFRKLLDAGEVGDNVGLLLRNVDAKSIARGMMILKDMK